MVDEKQAFNPDEYTPLELIKEVHRSNKRQDKVLEEVADEIAELQTWKATMEQRGKTSYNIGNKIAQFLGWLVAMILAGLHFLKNGSN